jgi:uncharacterized protein involved in exopolysaccharide biosynthesis
MVTKLRRQFSLAQANQATDDTRVQQIEDPVLPDRDKPSWPTWDTFMPVGAGGGFVLGMIVAGLVAGKYSRRNQALPAPPAGQAVPVPVTPT